MLEPFLSDVPFQADIKTNKWGTQEKDSIKWILQTQYFMFPADAEKQSIYNKKTLLFINARNADWNWI